MASAGRFVLKPWKRLFILFGRGGAGGLAEYVQSMSLGSRCLSREAQGGRGKANDETLFAAKAEAAGIPLSWEL